MKIRNGFVSNSSSSSFVLVYVPDDFDFDSHVEYMIDKYEKIIDEEKKQWKIAYSKESLEQIKRVTEIEVNNFLKKGVVYQAMMGDQYDSYYKLSKFFEDFVLTTCETYEEGGVIQNFTKKLKDKLSKIESENHDNIIKFGGLAEERRIKRAELKQKMKNVDPYEEEDWEDEL